MNSAPQNEQCSPKWTEASYIFLLLPQLLNPHTFFSPCQHLVSCPTTLLYFSIQRTEKYSIATCYINMFAWDAFETSFFQSPYQINMCHQGTRLISVNQIHIRPMSNLCRLLSSKNSEMWNRFKTANFRPDDLDVGGPHIFFVRGIRKTRPSIVCVTHQMSLKKTW